MKSRGVYETPGGTILYKAHELLEMITLDRDTSHYKKLVAEKYGELVYNGKWFSPLREALAAFVDNTQQTVTGDVKLKLYKGNVINAGVTSVYTLYDENVASFGDDRQFETFVHVEKRCVEHLSRQAERGDSGFDLFHDIWV